MARRLKVRDQRRQRRWTRKELADRADIPVEAVEDIETSSADWVDMPVLERIAEALGVQVDELLPGQEIV